MQASTSENAADGGESRKDPAARPPILPQPANEGANNSNDSASIPPPVPTTQPIAPPTPATVAGAEGTGHHFITALMMRLPQLMPMTLVQEQSFQALWWDDRSRKDPAVFWAAIEAFSEWVRAARSLGKHPAFCARACLRLADHLGFRLRVRAVVGAARGGFRR